MVWTQDTAAQLKLERDRAAVRGSAKPSEAALRACMEFVQAERDLVMATTATEASLVEDEHLVAGPACQDD